MLDAPPAAFAADRLAWRVRNSKPTLPEASDAAIRRACGAHSSLTLMEPD